MKSSLSDKVIWTLIGLAVTTVLVLVVICAWQAREEGVAKAKARVEICANICGDRGSEFYSDWRQQIGFGAFEQRCGCMDGHVQVIP